MAQNLYETCAEPKSAPKPVKNISRPSQTYVDAKFDGEFIFYSFRMFQNR